MKFGIGIHKLQLLDITNIDVTVHTETHAVCERPSPFVNGAKSDPVYKRTRHYERREDAKLRQYESRKCTWLRTSVECEKSLWGVCSGNFCRYGRTFFAGWPPLPHDLVLAYDDINCYRLKPEEFVNLQSLLVQSSKWFGISSEQFSTLVASLLGEFVQFSSGHGELVLPFSAVQVSSRSVQSIESPIVWEEQRNSSRPPPEEIPARRSGVCRLSGGRAVLCRLWLLICPRCGVVSEWRKIISKIVYKNFL